MLQFFRHFFLFSSFYGLLLHPLSLEARWAKKEDEGALIKKHWVSFQIKTDGSYTRKVEEDVEILREDARMTEGMVRLHYKPDSESFKIIDAYTVNGDRREIVPLDSIEDKPLASNGEGFDQTNQVTIVFPDVKVGSRVHYTYEKEFKVVQIPEFFSEFLFFGGDYYQELRVEVKSEIPLFYEINDPSKALRWKANKLSLTLKNLAPLHRHVIDEVESVTNPATHPWMMISTSKTWSEFAAPIIEDYEKVLEEPLPKSFLHIRKQALKEKTAESQMNRVTSELANHLRYHGDWRSVRGRNIPRPFKLVEKTRFGDCKDFAALTTAILRSIGIQADMAWVSRTPDPDFTPTKLPHTFFNHAIVRAEANGNVYWVDPTNTASFAQGIFEDIIDRPAFVLSAKAARVEHIPKGTPENSSIEEYQELTFGNRPHVKGKIRFTGREASFQAGRTKESSNESLRHHLIDFISRDIPVAYWQLPTLDWSDRITQDRDIPYEFSPKQITISTSAGTGFRLPTPRRLSELFDLSTDRVSDFFVTQPVTLVSEIRLQNIKVIGSESLSCHIESPWLTADRIVTPQARGAVVIDHIRILKSTLAPSDINSHEFVEFQQKLISCFRSNILIFSQK